MEAYSVLNKRGKTLWISKQNSLLIEGFKPGLSTNFHRKFKKRVAGFDPGRYHRGYHRAIIEGITIIRVSFHDAAAYMPPPRTEMDVDGDTTPVEKIHETVHLIRGGPSSKNKNDASQTAFEERHQRSLFHLRRIIDENYHHLCYYHFPQSNHPQRPSRRWRPHQHPSLGSWE